MTGWFHSGADEALRGVFWDLSQIGGVNGPKYPEPVLRRLAAKILDGRAHEPLVFRLCHLARCAALAADDDGGPGWTAFFCAPGAGRPGWAASWLRARLPPDGGAAAASADRAILRYGGRTEPITLSYGAVPLLAAFMEFLLNTLHYGAVRDLLAPLSRADLAWRALQDAANALSRAVYAWLRAHTRPVQDSRDFEAVAGFLAARGGRGDFTADDVDDEAVLGFWREVSAVPGSEFRTFRKTFRVFLRFAEAMREATLRAGLEAPEPMSGWSGSDEREPADPCSPGLDKVRVVSTAAVAWETAADEEATPLEEVAGAEVKLLLASEAKRLAPVDEHARLLPAFARSALRDARFGHAQGRISQRLRMVAGGAPAAGPWPPTIGYDDEAAAFEALLAHLDDLVAVAAVLLIGEGGGGRRRLDAGTLAHGRRALKNLRRQGFDELRAGAPEAVESVRRTVPALVELRARLASFCDRLRAGAPWEPRQDEDDAVFRAQFTRIYGAAAEGEGAAS